MNCEERNLRRIGEYREQTARFWTPERLRRAAAMRSYRQLWAACPPVQQHALECLVINMRAQGLPEQQIGTHVAEALRHLRPWRMTDAQLARAMRALM